MQFDGPRVIAALNAEWGWILPSIREVIMVNSMGNVFLSDAEERYWRVCPEELSAKIVARNQAELEALYADPEYKADWQMSAFVADLVDEYGEPEVGECFGLVVPATLGGDYSVGNTRRRCLYDYLRYAGDIANQTKDLEDCDTVEFKVV